jgi:hypothetical protein
MEAIAYHAGIRTVGFEVDTFLTLLSFERTSGIVLDIGRDRTQIVAYANGTLLLSIAWLELSELLSSL